MPKEIRENQKLIRKRVSKIIIGIKQFEITNVLHQGSKFEKELLHSDELPYRLSKLYSYVGETVLDPFCR